MLMFIKNLEELTNGLQRVELFADSEDDLDYEYYIGIDKTKLAPGSRCVIANGDIYFLNTQGEWVAAGTPSPRPPSPTPIETSYIYNDIKYSTNELQTSYGAREITLNKLTGKSVVEDGEVKSVSVTKITVDGTDYPVSFNGKSVGNAYDELDLVNKKYTQRIGSFDLSSLGKKGESEPNYIGWETPESGFFQTNLHDEFNIKLPDVYGGGENTKANVIFKNYRVISYMDVVNAISEGNLESINKCICALEADWKAVMIIDMDYSDVDSFLASIQGDMMYYEKAVPDETTVEIEPINAEVASKSTVTFDTDLDVGSEMTVKIEVVV